MEKSFILWFKIDVYLCVSLKVLHALTSLMLYMCIAEESCQLPAPSQALEEFQTIVAPIVRLQGAEISGNDSRMT